MTGSIHYDFSAKIWQHSGAGGWHFVSLPQHISNEIRENHGWQEEGWGRLKVKAKIGLVSWDTAIWYDTKSATYLLPVKAEIRKKHQIETGIEMEICIFI